LQLDQLLREYTCQIGIVIGPTSINPHIAALYPAQSRQFLNEYGKKRLEFRIVLRRSPQHADAPQPVTLLRLRRERPRRRAGKPRDEFAPMHR
jgi:hypothetical protein